LAHILVAATPAPGHVNPMLTVAQHLSSVGHSITFLSGELFRDQAIAAGFRFVPFTGRADIDYTRVDELFPERVAIPPGPARMNADCTLFGIDPIPDQHRTIQQILAESEVDLIVVDIFFWGTVPMLMGPRDARPPVIGCGVLPMILSSRDTSPLSLPHSGPDGYLRNQEDTQAFYGLFAPTTARFEEVLRECGVSDSPEFYMDCAYNLPDRFLMFTAEAFEFPRSDMKSSIQFVGNMNPKMPANSQMPKWWESLDQSKPLVLVTQGTVANTDPSQVIEPAIAGLADEDVTVVVAAGLPDLEAIQLPGGVQPANTKIENFIPFDKIMPKVDVFVTNGGYGSVNLALSKGVPIVIAGDTEDKLFTSVRIGWKEAGINLGTGRPTSEQIRTAVRAVLSEKKYRENAGKLQKEFARYNALDELEKTVESFLTVKTR
jgi:MGT family glycosyltransferase